MSDPLGGQELIEVAAAYFEHDPGATYPYAYKQICAQHEVGVSLRSFVSGGYATAARRLVEARVNAEPEEVPEPPRPSVAPTEPPATALTPAELAWERQEYRRRQREREEAFQAEREARAKRRREAFRLPKRRNGRRHPFSQDLQVGRKRRKRGEDLPPVEYLPAAEWVNTGVRRR